METWKKIGKALLFPPTVIVILLVPIAAVFLIYSALYLNVNDVLTIVSYVISFYTLMIVCFRVPDIIKWCKRIKNENRYIVKYRSDVQLRIKLSLYGTFLYNAAYAVLQLSLGLYHASIWFYSMAVYYILLAIMRFFLLRHTRAYRPGEQVEHELKKYRFCGICMLLMNMALTVIIAYITWQNRAFKHHEITTIAMATYTFGAFTLAIVNMVKYRKYKSPVYSAAKTISLASACVSMITLENAMITTFGKEEDESFRQWMLGASGGVVSIVVLSLAIYMIVVATKQLKQLRISNSKSIKEKK